MWTLCLGACAAYDESLLTGARGTPNAPPRNNLSAAPSGAAGAVVMPAAGSGVPTCVAAASADYCGTLPALPSAPQIDGRLECGLQLSPMAALGWTGAAPPDKRASYAAAWRPDGVYLYVEVQGEPIATHPADQPIFCGDAVELYVDADAESSATGAYDPSGTMQFVIAAPTSDSAPIEAARYIQGMPQGAWISKSLRTARRPGGYSVEAFIGAADLGLWEWTPNARLGFSVGVNVAGTAGPDAASCTTRAGQYFLRIGAPLGMCPGQPWCDAGTFCKAALSQ